MKKKKTQCSSSIHGLYAITDARIHDRDQLLVQASAAIQGGARVLQYRAKGIEADASLQNAQALAQLCCQSFVTFIINDDVDLAVASGADGVHIGKDDGKLEHIRAKMPSGIVGVSCYNDFGRAQAMQARGADYVAFGRFFPSRTKPDAPPADLTTLESASTGLAIPVVAIGGITPDNAPVLIKAGADAIAVVDGVFGASNIESAAAAYAGLFVG